ncbi:MAG: decarboxylating 6-phosphogluconate dehydrogenase [Chromatiales bacterium]|nr:MAG: decarboxylating 6-phosphogluconate dehydrogenase [Chromatiales bacterium]
MTLGLLGLGRMGGNMARRLRLADIPVTGWNRQRDVSDALAEESGLVAVGTVEELVATLPPPRTVWLMLPAGDITEQYVTQVGELLDPGDLLVDGANSWFKDSVRRNEALRARGLEFVDAGVSGGIWGLKEGYALMVGGSDAAVERLTPILKALAPAADRGWVHCGPAGSGHFAKMVHNGIEYGMMQAYAEGFALLRGREEFDLDLAAIAESWRHGSVVRSWLLDLTAEFLAEDQGLEDLAPVVADSGEGRWTAVEAVEQGIPAPVITTALAMRFASQGRNDYAARVLASMRRAFGGHAVTTRPDKG